VTKISCGLVFNGVDFAVGVSSRLKEEEEFLLVGVVDDTRLKAQNS